MTIKFRGAISHIGGAVGDLDAIPAASIEDGDGAFVIDSVNNTLDVYTLVAGSSAVEDTTNFTIVKPDDAGTPGDRWIKTPVSSTMFAEASYYYPNSGAADQGVTGNSDTIKYAVDTLGATNGVIHLKNNSGAATTTYTLSTAETIPANIQLKIEPGALIQPADGVSLTIYSPENIIASPRQQIIDTTNNSTNPLKFTKPGTVYLEWWGAIVDDGTDDSTYANCALQSFPTTTAPIGGIIKLHPGTYRADSSWVLPVNATTTIRSITIEGAGSSMGAGGATNPFGTRIDSYIDGGILFDLQTSDAQCINIRLSNFTAYDREGTGVNYGVWAYKFTAGCVLENVGFKGFTTSVYIETFAYYAKLDNVKSQYHRGWGIWIEGVNHCLLSRLTASNGTGASEGGLRLTAATTSMRGATVIGSFFEGNAGYGASVTTTGSYHAYAVNFIGNYFEGNGASKADIVIGGSSATYRVHSGTIQGNVFEQGVGGADHIPLNIGYVSNLVVTGNMLNVYSSNRTVYSTVCAGCFFAGNFQHASATAGIDIPAANTVMDAPSANTAASISDPSGGATVDAEARTAINAILDILDAVKLTK